MDFFGLLFLAFSSTLVLHLNLSTAQKYLTEFCLGGNYTTNSTFQNDLSILLSSISNNSTLTNNTKYFNNTVRSNSDGVYGIFQCRLDYTLEDCKKCAKNATELVTTRCPMKKESIIFYDECWLHYSDKPFTMQDQPTNYYYNPNNISNPDQFSLSRDVLMEELVPRAVSNSSLFAVGVYENIYGLVQCTQELSTTECGRCLNRSLSEIHACCDTRRGGRVLKPSCNIRFEIDNFIQPEAIIPRITAPPNTNTTSGQGKKSSKKNVVIIAVPTVIAVVLLLLSMITICFYLRRKKGIHIVQDVDEISSVESLQFDFGTIRDATKDFCDSNKLGEGGFGPVYKGKLSDGKEIAVKRLSRNSGQGVEEFKNEVLLLAKLQHRNLVRLFGFCLEGNEKLLIYEYVLNASLDQFLFVVDPTKRSYLDWERRYKIIGGIARGLLYLHEDSRHRIIHRDLKASNILLDAEMNPKISDFGMARLFVVDQTHGNTSRVVGTYGYMAPEYALHGQFSVKSDVFSFGVLVLEIIIGQKNNSFYDSEREEGLLSYAWRQWEEGTALELIEPTLQERCSRNEVMRCIHIGLSCVQEEIARRPTMASVVLMLNSHSVTLPLPAAPASFGSSNTKELDWITEEHGTNTTNESQPILPDRPTSGSIPESINEASITELYPR